MLDIKQILNSLPHRYPFLLVDRIIELEKGVKVVGIKCVTMNEPFFLGHYPNHPVMPGVMIVESMAQVCGFMFLDENSTDKVPYFTGIDNVRFRKPVIPGDQLRIEGEMIKFRRNVAKVNCRALVNDEVVSQGELMFTVVDK